MSQALLIKFTPGWPELALVDSETFDYPVMDFGFWGHYDWLKDENRHVVGARWDFNALEIPIDLADFLDLVKRLPYCKLNQYDRLEVIFPAGEPFSEEYSDDQEIDSTSLIKCGPKAETYGLLLNNPPPGAWRESFTP